MCLQSAADTATVLHLQLHMGRVPVGITDFLAPTCLLLESSRLQKAVLHAHCEQQSVYTLLLCGTLHCTWQVIGAITNNKSISTSGSLGALLDINSQCYMSYTLHVSTLADLLMQSAACIAVQHNTNHNAQPQLTHMHVLSQHAPQHHRAHLQ